MSTPELIGLIAFLVALTAFFGVYAFLAPIVDRKSDDENNQIKHDFYDDDPLLEEEELQDSLGKMVRPLLDNFLPQLPRIPMSEERKKGLNDLIIKSGNPWKLNAEELIASMIAFAVIGFMAALAVVAADVLPEQVPIAALLIGMPLMGAALPYSKYNSAKEARTKAIEKQLPEALDLLTITLDSGQVFETALESVTKQLPEGILKVELGRVVIELQASSPLARSLRSLNNRFKSEDLESFVKAVIQATKLGSEISETLTHQSEYVRSNYEARLNRMIARLQTTMFIPLIGTMLPAFMLILLAPTLAQLSEYL